MLTLFGSQTIALGQIDAYTVATNKTGKVKTSLSQGGEFVDDSLRFGDELVNSNDLSHIFGQAKHNMSGVLKSFNGNQVEAYQAIQSATQRVVRENGINGVFLRQQVEVAGHTITVNGTVIDGTVRIGTAYIPGL